MGDLAVKADDLVQLARLALAGRRQDVQLFLRRMARRMREPLPQVAEQLHMLLQESPTAKSPLRAASETAVPVDTDSRLQLIRHEFPVVLDAEPIWAMTVRNGLEQVIAERSKTDDLHRAGLLPTRSVLLTGKPGVGKTLAARWIAARLNRPLLILDLSAVMSSFLGRTGVNVRYVLDYAKGLDCVLLLDELDAIAKRRDDVTEIGELKRLVTVLLQEIDDWPPTGLLVAATNHSDLLDPAVWRRFEMILEFPMPSEDQTLQAVKVFLESDTLREGPLVALLAIALQGASFSEIEREVMRVRREAIIREEPAESMLVKLICSRVGTLSRQDRRRVASTMHSLGYSQRNISMLTGISRDTIRKELKPT